MLMMKEVWQRSTEVKLLKKEIQKKTEMCIEDKLNATLNEACNNLEHKHISRPVDVPTQVESPKPRQGGRNLVTEVFANDDAVVQAHKTLNQ